MVLPSSFSFFKNLFRSKNSFVSTSSLRYANQLSCKVSISNFSSSFCSSVSFASHASLSNFTAGDKTEGYLAAGLATGLGAPKNDVMVPLALGFLASASARSTALRFTPVAMVEARRKTA